MVSWQASRDLLRALWNFAKNCWQLWQGRGGREAEPAQGGPRGHDLHVNPGNKHEICPLLLHRNHSHWLLHSVSRVSAPPPLCRWHVAIVHCPTCNCYIQPAELLRYGLMFRAGKYIEVRGTGIYWYTDATSTLHIHPHLLSVFLFTWSELNSRSYILEVLLQQQLTTLFSSLQKHDMSVLSVGIQMTNSWLANLESWTVVGCWLPRHGCGLYTGVTPAVSSTSISSPAPVPAG